MKVISKSPQDTLRLGELIAKKLQSLDVVCLFGEFGSGKTVLVKGIGEGLGIKGIAINSPSFVLIRQYTQGRLPLYHFDLYRLKSACDITALGYEEYLYGGGVAVIEWADRLKYLIPKEFLKIELFIRPGTRRLLEFSAFGRRHKELLRMVHEDIRH